MIADEPLRQGRPTSYSQDVAEVILERLADGQSLRSICAIEGMPGRTTVYRWVLDDVEGFRNQYTRAREIQAYALEDDLRDIADNGSNDWMERNDPDNPGWTVNGEHLQRSRLRVDTRKWVASKILPKVYGEKVQQEIVGPNGGPQRVQIEIVGTPPPQQLNEAQSRRALQLDAVGIDVVKPNRT